MKVDDKLSCMHHAKLLGLDRLKWSVFYLHLGGGLANESDNELLFGVVLPS